MTSAISILDPGRVAEDRGIVTPCRDSRFDPEAWFAEGNTAGSRARTDAARNLCAYRCPLQAMCRDFALANKIRFGVWGGLTDSERETVRDGRHLRDPKARWLAGLTDHAGNPVATADNTAPAEVDDDDPERLVATPEAMRLLDLNSPQAVRALLGRHQVTPAVRGNQNRHSQYKLGDLLHVKARKRRYSSPTTAA